MLHWEYRVTSITIDLGKDANGRHETSIERDERIGRILGDLGKDGWELVALVPDVLAQMSIPWRYQAFFKRPSND